MRILFALFLLFSINCNRRIADIPSDCNKIVVTAVWKKIGLREVAITDKILIYDIIASMETARVDRSTKSITPKYKVGFYGSAKFDYFMNDSIANDFRGDIFWKSVNKTFGLIDSLFVNMVVEYSDSVSGRPCNDNSWEINLQNLRKMEKEIWGDRIDSYNYAFRFTVLPSFHEPFSITAIVEDKIVTMKIKYANGLLDNDTIRWLKNDVVKMAREKFTAIEVIDSAIFWGLRPCASTAVLDGSRWFLEVVKNGKGHIVVRHNPDNDNDDFFNICRELMRVAGYDSLTKSKN